MKSQSKRLESIELARQYFDGQQFDACIQITQRILRKAPLSTEALELQATAYAKTGAQEEAIKLYSRLIAVAGKNKERGFFNRGRCHVESGNLQEAANDFRSALAIKPDYLSALVNLGVALERLGLLEEALEHIDRSLKVCPDNLDLCFNKGTVLKALGRFDEARETLQRVIQVAPFSVDALINLGETYRYLVQLEDAEKCFDGALRFSPGNPSALFNKSLVRLTLGDFESGWKLYRYRWERPDAKVSMPKQLEREWRGGGRSTRLVLLPEQGLGDEIFFCAMVPQLINDVDELTISVSPRLKSLFERSFASKRVNVVSDEPAVREMNAGADFVYMGSLGEMYRSQASSFQAVKSFLKADEVRKQALLKKYNFHRRPTVGLSWRSKNPLLGAGKSLFLRELSPLLSEFDFDWVNLQYGETRTEEEDARQESGTKLLNVSEVDNTNDIEGLASLIECCDLVVTISNFTAHLAAGLGKEVALLLPYFSDWRWLTSTDSSPWYPTVKIFRQPAPGDWAGALLRVSDYLAQRFADRPGVGRVG